MPFSLNTTANARPGPASAVEILRSPGKPLASKRDEFNRHALATPFWRIAHVLTWVALRSVRGISQFSEISDVEAGDYQEFRVWRGIIG
jgi:hypothetical protein